MTYALLQLQQELASGFKNLSIVNRLAKIADLANSHFGKAVFTTSFGIEDQLITHIIYQHKIDIKLITLDTGRLFPETYNLWQKTEEYYGKRIEAKYPKSENLENLIHDQGINGLYYSIDMRKNCCHVRKIEPLARALKDATIWVTGLRSDQSQARQTGDFTNIEQNYNLIKANPLFDWQREAIVAFVQEYNLPINSLHEQGFLSIGCAPCTRAVEQGENERAGRWWWEDEAQKECGLHVQNGNLVRKQSHKQTLDTARG